MHSAPSETRLETIERDATLDLVAAAPPEVAHALGIVARPFAGGALLIAPGLRTPLFNRVFAASALTAAQLEEVAARFQAARVAWWDVQAAPAWLGAGAPELLGAAGLRPASRWVKMWRGRAAPPEPKTDLRVSLVEAVDAAQLGRVATEAFGMPPATAPWLAALVGRRDWRVYAAYDGDHMVASGALWQRGGVAWIGVGGTLPSHRRRGAQHAVMARRIADALDAGADLVVTETGAPLPDRGNPSYANMLRCGFRLAYERVNFSAAGTARGSPPRPD